MCNSVAAYAQGKGFNVRLDANSLMDNLRALMYLAVFVVPGAILTLVTWRSGRAYWKSSESSGAWEMTCLVAAWCAYAYVLR